MDSAASASANATAEKPPHMVLVPLLSVGHLIPMADLGRLLAKRGARVSLVTTPLNAARLGASFERARASGLQLDLVSLPLPSSDAGLPEGYESIDGIPTDSFPVISTKLQVAMTLFREPLRQFMATANATCMICDFGMPCTGDVAQELGVPRYVFNSICCFTFYCHRVAPAYLQVQKPEEDCMPVVVSGLPHRLELSREQVRGTCYGMPDWFIEGQVEAEATADGFVVNSFLELEADYVNLYSKEMGKKVFPVGPVSLCNSDAGDRAARATGLQDQPSYAADHLRRITEWLDRQAPRSVVYVCFGSLVKEHPRQLEVIGDGLQAAGSPFLWVVREDQAAEIASSLAELEQRSGDTCLIVRGWTPQLAILSHPSVGGFLSHCGWNSFLEAVTCGVPVATWPCFADQLLNAKFAVDVAGVGVPVVGCERPLVGWWGWDDPRRRTIGWEEVEAAVKRLMDGGEEAEARRRRARELADKARRAVEAGSSDANLAALIAESMSLAKERFEIDVVDASYSGNLVQGNNPDLERVPHAEPITALIHT